MAIERIRVSIGAGCVFRFFIRFVAIFPSSSTSFENSLPWIKPLVHQVRFSKLRVGVDNKMSTDSKSSSTTFKLTSDSRGLWLYVMCFRKRLLVSVRMSEANQPRL